MGVALCCYNFSVFYRFSLSQPYSSPYFLTFGKGNSTRTLGFCGAGQRIEA